MLATTGPRLRSGLATCKRSSAICFTKFFFHSVLATEQGWFDIAQVAQGIHDKLYERHPHVYGDTKATLDELPANWEAAKRKEKGRNSVMDGIPVALPALLYASKVQKKAIAIGHTAPVFSERASRYRS